MKTGRKKQILKWFRSYYDNKRELQESYHIPTPSAIVYDKIAVKSDPSSNGVENMTVEYIARREELYKQVYIVDEVIRYLTLEGHGRESFVYVRMIKGLPFKQTAYKCCAGEATLFRWKNEIVEKADMVAKWLNY